MTGQLIRQDRVRKEFGSQVRSCDRVVALTSRQRMDGLVLCGHPCSRAIHPATELARILERADNPAAALAVLPTTNLHLQDMQPGRSRPRQRGRAPMHELRAAEVSVLLGADNVADPFDPHGSDDQIEFPRLACLAAHLSPVDWRDTTTSTPARALGIPAPGLAAGERADFILIDGASWDAAPRSARSSRRIIRSGLHHSLGKVAA